MKREIKFRGKSEHSDEWCFGNLVDYGDGETEIHGFDVFREGKGQWKEIRVIPETIGQFTGLCDKNRKEIYEGDIINFTFHSDMTEHANLENRPEITRLQIVEFYDYRFVLHDFMLDKENVTCFNFPFSDKFRHRYEVAGNIYDNPELIK